VGIGTGTAVETLHVEGNVVLSGANRFVGTTTATGLGLRTNNLNRVFIDGNGNVGIGTTISFLPLNINGNTNVSGTIFGNIFTTLYDGVGAFSATNTRTLTIPYPGIYLFTLMSTGVTINVVSGDSYAKAIIYILISPNGTLTTNVVNSVGVAINSYTAATQTLSYNIGTGSQTVNGGGGAYVSIIRLT
jgi:hypothetical protein